MSKLRSISVSAIEVYQRCREEYRYGYALGWRPIKTEHALEFGSAIHAGLEVWWVTLDPRAAVEAAHAYATQHGRSVLDAFDFVTLEVLLLGYHARWLEDAEQYSDVYAEEPFRLAGHGYALVGKLDARARRRRLKVLVEHKSTAQDIQLGAPYWDTLAFDTQIGLYLDAVQRMHGPDYDTVIYDVIAKPTIKPARATPEKSRKYKKDGTLYAKQRTEDEPPTEWRQRLLEHVAKYPEKYFQRQEVVRLESEIVRLRRDVHTLAVEMAAVGPDDPQPRSGKSCRRFGGRACPYLEVCAGTARLDNPARFRNVLNRKGKL